MLNHTLTQKNSEDALVFLHGFMGSGSDFNPLIQHLGDEFSTLTIDLPGHGSSSMIDPLTFDSVIEEIKRVIKIYSLKKVHLVGYSLGGRIILDWIKNDIDSIHSVCILSSHFGLLEKEKKAREEFETKWVKSLKSDPFDQFLDKWYKQSIFQSSGSHEMVNLRKNNNPKHLCCVFEKLSLLKQKCSLEFLSKTSLPLLFACGSRDKKYLTLYKNLPTHISWDIIENACHAIHLENPRACALTITQFIKEVTNGTYRMGRLFSI